MKDLGAENSGAPHTVRKVLFAATGLALIAGGTLAWQVGGQPSSHRQSIESMERNSSRGETTSKDPLPSDQSAGRINTLETPRGTATNHSSTQVKINGQEIPVPPDGHLHQTFKNSSGETTIDVEVHSSSRTTVGGTTTN